MVQKLLRRDWISLFILVAGFFSFSDALLAADDVKYVDHNFTYTLFNSDFSCWRDGSCAGPVKDVYPARGMAKKLETLLAGAQSSVDFAVYGYRQQTWFKNQIRNLDKKGVKLRFTVDQMQGEAGDWDRRENFMYPEVLELVKILGDRFVVPDVGAAGHPRNSIMHDKFFVVDQRSVWLGSANISETDTGEYSANASILVKSREVAQIYADEFRRMFLHRTYSVEKPARANRPTIVFKDGTRVSVYFSPQDNPIQAAVIPFIQSAQQTLDIGMFYLTDVQVANELIDAHDRGVRVRLIHDAAGAAHPSSQVDLLRANGIEVRVENWGGKMHMKTAVADGRDVLMGSMNWSQAGGAENDENTLVIENNVNVAREMRAYINELWQSLPASHAPFIDPHAEARDSINSCQDGLDNDHDGLVDSEERSCQ